VEYPTGQTEKARERKMKEKEKHRMPEREEMMLDNKIL